MLASRSRLRRAFAVAAAIALGLVGPVGCAAARASRAGSPLPPALVTPGHRMLSATPRGDLPAYRFLAPPGSDSTRGPLPMGRTLVSEVAVLHDGVPAILRVLRVPSRGLVDSLLVRRADLAPIRERQHAPGRFISVDFDGRRVRWARELAGRAPQTGDTTYRVPVFAFNQLEMLVRALAAPPGATAVVPMVSEATAEMELDTLTVVAVDGARRHLRFADSAVVARYELDDPGRAVVVHEITMRDGGATYRRVGADGAGTTFRDCAACPPMVVVPAGAFTIGSPDDEPGRGRDEAPRRRIAIRAAFAVSRFEVTRGEYDAFLRESHRPIHGGCLTDRVQHGTWAPEPRTTLRDPGFAQTDAHPVVCVSWDDAQAYVAWLEARTGGGYRLLTEAEWEYAARAGSTTAYPWGPSADAGCAFANVLDVTARARYAQFETAGCADGALNTAPVGAYRPNAFGLHDMIGNVGEWVADCASDSYAELPEDGAARGGDCARHVVRSGSWGTLPKDTRVANRVRYPAGHLDDSIGLRVAKTLR